MGNTATLGPEYEAKLKQIIAEKLAAGVPQPVIDAVVKAWRDQAVEILTEIRHDTLNGCYTFNRWSMYVGVEYDGYIHT